MVALLAHRREHIAPLIPDFKNWMAAVEPTLLPSEPLAAAIRYYGNHGDALFRFVDDVEVPIDNSPTEREFQNVAKLRLNMLFAGSTEGAHRASVLLGIVATCRAIGVPAQAYLAWAFDRHGRQTPRARRRATRSYRGAGAPDNALGVGAAVRDGDARAGRGDAGVAA